VPIMKAWPYENLKTESVKASAVEESSREYLRQRFDELSKDEYLAIMDGLNRCIHPEPLPHPRPDPADCRPARQDRQHPQVHGGMGAARTPPTSST